MEAYKPLNDNKVLLAGVMGIISTVAGEICSWIIRYLGFGVYSTYELNSFIITYNKKAILIGFILNVMVGAMVGAAVYLTLKKWGEKHIFIVSLLFTLVAWLFLEFVFNAVVDTNIINSREMSGYYNQFISAVVHAIAKAALLKYFVFKRT